MRRVVLLMLLCCGPLVQAGVEVQRFVTPEQEARYQSLIHELRCLVCQNQNLADSNAELARDLRKQTRDLISDGKTDREIIDYMVARYGDFVLDRPPLKPSTLLLWGGPFIFLITGVAVVFLFIRRRNRLPAPGFSEQDQLRVRQLLHDWNAEQ